MVVVRGWQAGVMSPRNTSVEDGLRHLLNEWDPIGVVDDVQDEYDCMLAPLLKRLRSGADRSEIGEFLRHELEDHFGLDALGLRPDAMAVRVIDWWTSASQADDVAGRSSSLPIVRALGLGVQGEQVAERRSGSRGWLSRSWGRW